jgi:V/A-type H+-transporting ATPase subunit C
MAGKIRLGMYPYTYARVSAMRGKLLDIDSYHKLLKMKSSEIAKFLQETEYKKEIDELAVTYSGIDLVEIALSKNLIKAFLKLKRISHESLKLLVEAYLRRMDIVNLKIIMRAKFTNAAVEEVEPLLMPVGDFDRKYFLELMKKESVEEIVQSLKFVDLTEALRTFKEKNTLYDIENKLDHHYYESILEFTERIPEQGDLFKRFLKNEIDVLNMKILLRLKKENVDAKEIENYLFFSGRRLGSRELKKLAAAPSIEEMLEKLKKYGYSKVIEAGEQSFKKDNSLIDIEIELNRFLLDGAILLLHQHPLSIDVILGYMFAKEIEIKNLKTLIKGKQLNMEEDFIIKELVMGK